MNINRMRVVHFHEDKKEPFLLFIKIGFVDIDLIISNMLLSKVPNINVIIQCSLIKNCKVAYFIELMKFFYLLR